MHRRRRPRPPPPRTMTVRLGGRHLRLLQLVYVLCTAVWVPCISAGDTLMRIRSWGIPVMAVMFALYAGAVDLFIVFLNQPKTEVRTMHYGKHTQEIEYERDPYFGQFFGAVPARSPTARSLAPRAQRCVTSSTSAAGGSATVAPRSGARAARSHRPTSM